MNEWTEVALEIWKRLTEGSGAARRLAPTGHRQSTQPSHGQPRSARQDYRSAPERVVKPLEQGNFRSCSVAVTSPA